MAIDHFKRHLTNGFQLPASFLVPPSLVIGDGGTDGFNGLQRVFSVTFPLATLSPDFLRERLKRAELCGLRVTRSLMGGNALVFSTYMRFRPEAVHTPCDLDRSETVIETAQAVLGGHNNKFRRFLADHVPEGSPAPVVPVGDCLVQLVYTLMPSLVSFPEEGGAA